MAAQKELHGEVACPFAWRTRLAASEKGVSFDYIAFDVPDPDPRAALNNPDSHSPLLVHAGFRLTESGVIAQYIDEAFSGRALVPHGPKDRARMRVDQAELAKLETDTHAGVVLAPEVKQRVGAAQALLDQKLSGCEWLGGDAPNLADLMLWPVLAELELRARLPLPPSLQRATAYWARAKSRPSYLATRPPWAA